MKRVLIFILTVVFIMFPIQTAQAEVVELETSNGFTYIGFMENGTYNGFAALFFPDEIMQVGMFKDGMIHGLGITFYPGEPGDLAMIASFFQDGLISGSTYTITHGKDGIFFSGNYEDGELVSGSGVLSDEYEFASFQTAYTGITYTGMVLAGTETPHGYGMYIDTILNNWHVGYFKNGVPDGYGVQAVFESEEWFFGTWSGGLLDKFHSFGGKANRNSIMALTSWPGIAPTPAQSALAQTTPAQTTPAQTTPAQTTPAQTTPAQTASAPRQPSNAANPSGLIVVSHPPIEYHTCKGCDGKGTVACPHCSGPGSNNRLPSELTQMPGSGMFGIVLTFMNTNCMFCGNRGTAVCPFICADGKSFEINAEYVAYLQNLAMLAEATGVNVFEIAAGHEKRFISVQDCVHCKGSVVSGQFVCMSCISGYHVNFPNNPNDRFIPPPANFQQIGNNAFAGITNFYREAIADMAARRDNSPWFSASSSRKCLNCGESGYPICSSCKAGRSAIDLGAKSTGNCVRCGGKTYTSAAHCGACR
jgi:hypothetical protein